MAAHPSLDIEAGTSAIDNSFYEKTVIHNRDFQQYSIANQVYLAPIDEDEQERQEIFHDVLSRVFDNRLLFPLVSHPRRILDCGYGCALWASEVAAQNPHCEVLGIDINPWQPERAPSNLYLQVDDLNREFNFSSHSFDLVHSQMMASGIHINRWTEYMNDMLRVTRPGGWTQMVELYYNVQSDNGSLTEDHALRRWSHLYLESHQGLKDLRVPLRLPAMMREAGFVDVENRMLQLPTCAWPTDQRENAIGAANRENIQRMLFALAVYPFTERLGITIQDVQLLVAQARVEADNPSLKAYFPLYVCLGRKSRSRR
ncbi:UMTA methyltransferase [Amylocarpus encephaloides]|uniref:UMTA methyltransferase n=1 Tax=Amylocarpus encephaloides TaxID=45428 RepID=A0A9P7YML7_9HELO|nr:UMTA methyltransferase [Amylocarpus encephaloides]